MRTDPKELFDEIEATNRSAERGTLLGLLTQAVLLLLHRAIAHDQRWTAKD